MILLNVTMGEETGERTFMLRAHLGNYSLWLAGLFPERFTSDKVRRSLV